MVTSWLTSDVDDLFVAHSDERTMRFNRQDGPETRGETTKIVDQYIAEQAANGFTKGL